MQVANNYERDVFNGDLGLVAAIDMEEGVLTASFKGRAAEYGFGELDELVLAYATTIHKAQGSRVSRRGDPAGHPALRHAGAQPALHRRDPRQAASVVVGSHKALAMAVRNGGARRRWSKLREWLRPAPDRKSAERRTTLAGLAENV